MRNCGYKFMNNNCQQLKQNQCNNMQMNNSGNNSCCNHSSNNHFINSNNSMNNNCCGNRPSNNGRIPNNQNCNRNCNDFMDMDNDECPNERMMEELKLQIQQCEFSIIELALYLDTHPDDYRAICMHNEHSQHYRKLTDEYQKIYGPLTIMFPCNSWRWLEQPWPWQNSANIVETQFNRASDESIDTDYENRNKSNEECDYDLKGGVK